MIFDVWIRVFFYLSIRDLSKFRQTDRFIHQCIENELIKNFSWYRYHKQMENLQNILISVALRSSNELHYPEKGCTFLMVSSNNKLFLKITDYLGTSKFIQFCEDARIFGTEGNRIFQISVSHKNEILVNQLSNHSYFIFDITSFQFTNALDDNVYLDYSFCYNEARLFRCFDRPHHSISYPRERQFQLFNCSVTLRFKSNYLYCKKFSLFLNQGESLSRCNLLYGLHTWKMNHWVFTHFDINMARFFYVAYHEHDNSFTCKIIHLNSQLPINDSFVCHYFLQSQSIAIIRILSDSRWHIIHEFGLS